MTHQLILDTDIGSDVDDALALALVQGSPEIDLVGITTVYGDTLLRARLARRLARIARPDFAVPVIPGAGHTLSGREIWWPGHEGALFPDLDQEPVDTTRSAVDFLVETVGAAPGTVDILAIGPLTNIALALRADPGFARNVGTVYIMGGDFAAEGRKAEHNFRCDSVAAREVFDSELNIVVAGLDITEQIALADVDVAAIESAGEIGVALKKEIAQFWTFHGNQWNNPHDPISALTLIAPELFTAEPRRVTISIDGDEGFSDDEPRPESRVRVVTRVDADATREHIVRRIAAAAG